MENVNTEAKPWYKKWWVLLIVIVVVGYAINNKGDKPRSSNAPQNTIPEKKIHRCGRTWSGQRHSVYGQFGDYCSERCYVEFYPN
jgi:hypothetical protein